ncbi:DUF2339 domain-containing protein [Pseudomonas syringae pv. tagetis]|uniref:DUF2339 domain-containing protein n=1 Tax=Pseudomonas syringae pv. tagetis TaxID=129140 RepID=A0A0Q0CX24_9PSED|nr:DUF2339 domain-containing protein [Pseudomonas syringae group genomosp. 7]KPY89719.1 Uncharacterized protein ALO44_01015 [Pseudomonas syringae pv. tagetis]RMW15151.1 hypothetical protein ALO98_02814 [Pseudomonas syringae pv. tagetis]RMW16170.1 hypothetical protein ALO97_02662 [Pseudomonas syringae pv. tagetis]UNB68969.1 DUF2339 domain-containing protein [Pseudomonas syringae pv. tagetis]
MLWICLVGGAALGYSLSYDEWTGALIGAVMGWAVWAGIHMRLLGRQSADQRQQLLATRQSLDALQQRLSALERQSTPGVPPAQDPAPLPADAIIIEAPTDGPELIWDLPDEEPQTAAHVESAPESRYPPKTARPPLLDSAVTHAKNWLLGGNTVLRVGVVVLFLGLAFLLRYATEGMIVPIEARYAGVAASALALLALGWRLRLRNAPYALVLQGAGVGVLYLTVFAAMKLHALLDPALGFALLVAITSFSAILALTQYSLALACAGALGGFAAPLLASTGQGSHVSLFSYFALLNAGIIAIAWFKAWRILNLIGFFGTFGIGFAWGIKAYTPALFWSTEPFLALFFVMYLAIGLLFARRKLLELDTPPPDGNRDTLLRWSARQGDYVDGTLLLGTPIAGYGLQYALVEHLELGAALSALALGLIYMSLARWLAKRASDRTLLLMETCLALGVAFATLAIPLGLGSQWTTCAWAVEGAAVLCLGLRQQRRLAQAFGLLLQVCASAMLISDSGSSSSADNYWTPMILAVAALFSAWSMFRFNTLAVIDQKIARTVLTVWGAIWWTVSLISVVQLYVALDVQTSLLLIAASLSAALWALLALRLRWPDLAALCSTLTPVSAVLLLGSLSELYHPADHWGWLAWPVVFAVHLLTLRYLADRLPIVAQRVAHATGCLLLIAVLALELRFGLLQLSESYNAWRWLGWAILPSLFLLAMSSGRQWPWPVRACPEAYHTGAAAPLAALMLAWFWLANTFSDGAADPLPYLPLINPLEIGLLLALAGVCLWMRNDLKRTRNEPLLVAGASLFALVTAMVMRAAHHWADVPWSTDALLESMRVQAGLSIVWTLMALALMIGGHVRANRELWLGGAALIGVVVVKLFFVELSNRGGMERIVSFIGVGILLLVVGYFAPLPPKHAARAVDEEPDPGQTAAPDTL